MERRTDEYTDNLVLDTGHPVIVISSVHPRRFHEVGRKISHFWSSELLALVLLATVDPSELKRYGKRVFQDLRAFRNYKMSPFLGDHVD